MHENNSPGCNCEDCWWARGCKEACACCGLPVHETESAEESTAASEDPAAPCVG